MNSRLIDPQDNSRHRSIRSITKQMSLPTRTQLSSDPTVTHPIQCSLWICGLSRLFFPFLRSIETATTRFSFATAIPTTTGTLEVVRPETNPEITWLSGQTGKGRSPRKSKKHSDQARSYRWLYIAPSY